VKYILIIAFLLPGAPALQAQKEANTWYFGRFAGISFDQSPPVALTDCMTITEEGCAAISDKNGNLLFYTNGLIVVNAQQQMMKNGGNLLGDRSSTQNAVIVPQPGNDSMYYIFTTGAEGQVNKGMRYSVVNMRRENGLGEVVQENVPLCSDCYEKIAAVRHCNRKDIWIMSRSFNSSQFVAYRLTAQGLSANPTQSNTGFNTGSQPVNTIGAMKFSADGKKMGAAHGYDADRVEVMDFSTTTGALTNAVIFKPNNIPGPPISGSNYGLEFAPGGKLLYVTANDFESDSSFLYQFDISSGNAATILASRQTISASVLNNIGNIQAGPDGKLYVSFFGYTHLGVINNPDVPGTGCNFVRQGVSLNPTATRYAMNGLPTFMVSIFNPAAQPYDFSRVPGSCNDLNVGFTLDNTVGVDSVLWSFGDGQQSKLPAPFHLYGAPGYYNVQLVVYKVDCSGVNDTITKKIWIASAGLLGPDVSGCLTDNITIGTQAVDGAIYLWNTGDRTNMINPASSGKYWLDVEQNGCVISDTVNVAIRPSPFANIGPDTVVCIKNPIELDAGNAGASFLWNTGATSQKITVNKPGVYRVTVTVNGCPASDTAEVDQGDCEFYIPNAFTPNGDGINDGFGLIGAADYSPFSFRVYSRWGQTVFRTVSSATRWDGNFKGLAMPAGAYPWIIDYVNKKGRPIKLKGVVLLVR
jgi:gliding motility-associated-like protein